MTKFKFYSAKDQGSYKKGELLYSYNEEQMKRYFPYSTTGDLYKGLTSDGENRIYVKKVTE